MNNTLNHMEEILDHQICGFHQYVLTSPVHLSYVSNNLCEMLGVRQNALLDDRTDLYAQMIHPADREKYSDFINRIIVNKQALTGEYRLIKKDGTIICVRDTITPKKLYDGTLIGHSVLTDITDIKNENTELQFLSETVPCGFLRYTCEKQPRITYVNSKMIELLRFPEVKDGEMDYLEMFKSNIFLMIPMDAVLIEQVTINLLENAIVHAESILPIDFIVEDHADHVSFIIRDYGKGLSEEKLQNLFDITSYSGSSSQSSDSHKGMGIGLSICKTIITAHHGTLSGKNHEDGAEFCFTLPKTKNKVVQ